MKTISVREAAQALGLTPRAVNYRLEKGHLKGILGKNETTGQPEWRVYPNKEIMSGLNASETPEINFEPADDVVVEAESVESATGVDDVTEGQRSTFPDFQAIAEQFVRPLVDEVKAQALALAEKDRIIEEQSRQLRLLPDLEKRAAEERALADEERKVAQMKALEIEALNKQVQAMSEEKAKLEAKADEATALAADLQSLKATVEKLQQPWWKKWFAAQAPGETKSPS